VSHRYVTTRPAKYGHDACLRGTRSEENHAGADLVIRGDKRVADVYLGKFMRLRRHHNFRYIVTTVSNATSERANPQLSKARHDSWGAGFFAVGRFKHNRQLD
jgi:hypothetical protein